MVSGGLANTATGDRSAICGGHGNIASAQSAAIGGGRSNVANGLDGSIPGGVSASLRGLAGKGAWASGQFAAAGDAQAGEHVLRRQSTDASAVRVTADGGAPGSANTVNLPNNGAFLARLWIVARQVGGTAGAVGDSAAWDIVVLVKRGASAATTALVGGGGGAIAPTVNDAGAGAWRLAVQADTTNGGLAVSGTGEANKTINWVARILSAEVVG